MGDFKLGQDNLVTSKFSFMLARSLMKESPVLRALLRKIKDPIDPVGFDFQVSGSPRAMNIQWLDSQMKKNVKERIPNYIQRRIDRGLNDE